MSCQPGVSGHGPGDNASVNILGFESSCDETGVALVHAEAVGVPRLRAQALHSQVAMHEAYGGVVPELASRDHIRRVLPLARQVLADAGATLADVDLMGNVHGARVYEHLSLEVEKGAVRLRMRRAPTDERPGGDELIGLPRWNEKAWLATGLAVPRGFVPLDEVHDAVVALLTGQAYGLRALGGYEAGLLLDVEIDEFDLQGKLVRTVIAARGRIDRDGPSLVLEDGVSVQDGVERELYKGRARLPLPGASLTTVPMLAGALP